VVRELQPDAELVRGDTADSTEVDQMFRQIRSRHGRLDAFANNAGITQDGFAVMTGEAT
jgi:3-oxoacyl-[acyl-carrier protein] reductase